MSAFLRRPQTVWGRRWLFYVHLCLGLFTGTYIVLICVTGAALVFRIDMQRALYPELFTPKRAGAQANLVEVFASVARAYPNHHVSGIDAPTVTRPTALAYVSRGQELLTVLIDPTDATVLGELPAHTAVLALQDLHFELFAGGTGRRVNGIGAGCLLLMCATGLVIWWPGSADWRRGFTIDFSRGWKRVTVDLHRAAGFWTLAFVMMWAVTGIYFAFSAQVRSVVNWFSPLSIVDTPRSDMAGRGRETPPDWATLLANAQREMPGRYAARIVVPGEAQAPLQILFARARPTPLGPGELTPVYLDQYNGQVLPAPQTNASAGDVALAWLRPLHVGDFAGPWVKPWWFMLGLVPPGLFMSGFIMWWNRVLRRRWPKKRLSEA